MKLTTALILLLVLQIDASVFAQNSKFTIEVKNQSIKDVLRQIEEQSQYRFFYSENLMKLDEKVTVDQKEKSIESLLDVIFDNRNISYEIKENKLIVLRPTDLPQVEMEISGKVTDQSGEALPGVSVVVKGTTRGTITDMNGNFSVQANPSSTLVFSFIGMTTQEIAVSGKTKINVSLSENTIGVGEVVVVGYGTVKKANLTGAVSSVDFSELEGRPASNTATLLQGQMSGVTVSNFNNQPGQDNPQIRIRGIGTMNAGSEPLVIVDGVESSLNQIPASDIESVSVLKDAASASIYGVRAANGVILVTTKRGKSAKPVVSIKQSMAFQQALVKPNLVSSWDYATIQNLDLTEQGQPALFTDTQIQLMRDGTDPDKWANTNWFDEMYRTAPMNTTYLSVGGSKESVRYMLSMEYLDQEGIMIKTGQKRYSFRSNIDVDITKKIKFGMNVAGNKNDITETLNDASSTNSDNDLNYIIRRFANPIVPVKYSNGNWGQVHGLYYLPGSTVGGIKNPVEFANRGENITERYSFQGKIFAEIELFKNLKYRPSFAYIFNSSILSKFTPTYKTYDANEVVMAENIHNSLVNNNNTNKKFLVENLLTYNFAIEKHNFNALLGQSSQLFRVDFMGASVEDFPNNSIHELNGGINKKNVEGYARELALDSYFGRLGYNYDDKYMFEFNYRYDGTSRFSPEMRWGGFPSLSAGWVASNEDFLSNMGPVSFLKMRGSWGQLGNQSLANNDFGYYPYVQNISTSQNYLWGGYIAPGVAVTSLANPNLTWETTTILDFGVDFNLYKNKIQVVADWFDKTSTDILVQLPIPGTLGNLGAPYQNVGEMKNTGWELDVKYQDKIGKVDVFGGFNLSHVKNEVTNYGGLKYTISNNAITKEGEALDSYYAYIAEGYYQTAEELASAPVQFGKPLRLGDVKYKDISGPDGVPDGKITADYDRTIIGNQFPDLQYSFNLGASYNGFDVYAFFQGISGVKRFYWYNTETAGTFTSVALDYWTEENREAATPRWGNLGNNTVYSSFWLKDASYLRLKNLEFGYTIPELITKKVNVSKARIYFSGINLWTKTDVVDYDPEKLTNDDRNRDYPQAKVYSVGLNITF